MSVCEKVKHSADADCREWNVDYVRDAIASAIENTLEGQPPNAWLPWTFDDSDGIHGPRVSDPGTIYISLPFSNYGDYGDGEFNYAWSTSFSSLVNDLVDDHEGGNKTLRVLALHLRDLADRVDAAIAVNPSES